MARCISCGIDHDKPANFCSELCFDYWYEMTQIPLIIDMINKIVFGAKDKHANNGLS
jgi:hypothetical protein